jgi:hypothetical protein
MGNAVATGILELKSIFWTYREQAFDAVSFTATKEATLLEANISVRITDWIYFTINNRYITLTCCDHSITKKVTKSSPKGAINCQHFPMQLGRT